MGESVMLVEEDNIGVGDELLIKEDAVRFSFVPMIGNFFGRKEELTASTPALALRPTSTLNTQYLLHFLSLASPSIPIIFVNVVLTLLPSKCNQSNGAGLVGLTLGPYCNNRRLNPGGRL